ncbi:MAG: restriction endonuclease subunit S, partial [Deltaproteobacteria bacterium]
WFQGPEFRSQAVSVQDQTDMAAYINLVDLRAIDLTLPPLSEQRAIAEVLGALDDKIEANRKIRTTARMSAMALFAQACQQETIPMTIGELSLSVSRGVAPNYTEPADGIPVINQKCIRDGWITLQAARCMRPIVTKPERVAQRGDVLVNSTGTGTLGRVGRWIPDRSVHVDGHVTIVRPHREKYPPVLLAYAMLAAQNDIANLAEGSTGQTELSRSRLAGMSIEVPMIKDRGRLVDALERCDDLAESLLDETCSLENLRDTLLPKLLAGEIRASSSEQPPSGMC